MKRKIQLYVISLWFLWLLIFLNKFTFISETSCGMWYLLSGWGLLKANVVALVALVMMGLAYVFYRNFKYDVVDRAPDLSMDVAAVEGMEYETLSFLITFIIPLASFDLDFDLNEGRNLFLLFVTLYVIGVIYVRTNMFHTNPTLAIWGFKVYKVTLKKTQDTDPERVIVVIAQKPIKANMTIHPRKIDDTFYYVTAQ